MTQYLMKWLFYLSLPTIPKRKASTTARPMPKKNPKDRYVNLWFTKQKIDDIPIDRTTTLVKSTPAYLRVQIAPFDKLTLLAEAEAVPFTPQDIIVKNLAPELKGKPIPIEVTLYSNDFEIPDNERTQPMMLKSGEPTEIRYFKVTPRRTGILHLRVCVFYKNNMLQSLMVTTHAAAQEKIINKAQTAHVEMTFSADFSNAGSLSPRGLWIGINENSQGTHTVCLKGDDFANDKLFALDLAQKLKEALAKARDALMEVSFAEIPLTQEEKKQAEITGTSPKVRYNIQQYRFNYNNSPCPDAAASKQRFIQDMTKLAGVGRDLYNVIFEEPPSADDDTISEKRKTIEERLETEEIIQVARLVNNGHIWPWALIYDLPIDKSMINEVCQAFNNPNGQVMSFNKCKEQIGCRYKTLQNKSIYSTVICPYGFWGFKHIIEQPTQYGGKKAFDNLVPEIKTHGHSVYEMLVASSLNSYDGGHLSDIANNYHFKRLGDSKQHIVDVIRNPPGPHIVYFYCHGEYDDKNNPYLIVENNIQLSPSDLYRWSFDRADSHALVFINGCHTLDLDPGKLSELMEPLVKAKAAGIIGTEITVYTTLANEFARGFFKRFLSSNGNEHMVGAIIKELRLELLAKYNPLGLVYTPYCSADLKIVE
jgi:hypothetical protein